MPLHDPNNPRHARIFDLLRHGDPSVDGTGDHTGLAHSGPSIQDQDAVKQAALQSFARSDLVNRALEPGRNHKLF